MLIIHDRNGERTEFEPVEGKPLMFQLRPLKIGVVGWCNGRAVCGTCHVYVAESGWTCFQPWRKRRRSGSQSSPNAVATPVSPARSSTVRTSTALS